MLSDLKFENYRDREGKWTNYKTGRRLVYCKKPTLNLKPFTRIGLWNASIYYRGQVRPKRNVSISGNTGEQSNVVQQESSNPQTEVSTTNVTAVPGTEMSSTIPTANPNGKTTPKVPLDSTNSVGKSDRSPSQDKTANKIQDNKKTHGKSTDTRGRSLKRNKTSQNQKQISSIFKRRESPSNSRSRTKRAFNNDSSSYSPPTPKSNSRSHSYHTDWFDVTVEGDL